MSSHNNIINQNTHCNGTVAYAVSPVSHLNQNQINSSKNNTNNNNNKQAPLVSTNNNESFDDDEHNEEEEDDDDEEGCYESPTAALRNKIENYHIHQKSQTIFKTNGLSSEGVLGANGGTGNSSTSNTNGNYAGSGNGSSSCNGSEQYDHVDHTVYDQANGIFVDETDEPTIGTALVMYSFAGKRSVFYSLNFD